MSVPKSEAQNFSVVWLCSGVREALPPHSVLDQPPRAGWAPRNHRSACAAGSSCHENQCDGLFPQHCTSTHSAGMESLRKSCSVDAACGTGNQLGVAHLMAGRLCSWGLHWCPCTGGWEGILTTVPVRHPEFWSDTKLKKSPSAKRTLLPILKVIFCMSCLLLKILLTAAALGRDSAISGSCTKCFTGKEKASFSSLYYWYTPIISPTLSVE